MKLIFLSIALLTLLLGGCTYSTTYLSGGEFNSSVVSRIQKGVTTTSQILHWLGEPFYKGPVSATEITWLYTWARPTGNPNVVPFGHRNIGNSGYKKTLWLFIKDDIVVNYTYEEGVI
jgi:hypothetical protein